MSSDRNKYPVTSVPEEELEALAKYLRGVDEIHSSAETPHETGAFVALPPSIGGIPLDGQGESDEEAQ